MSEYSCSACGLEWRDELPACPRCRSTAIQQSMFSVPRIEKASEDAIEGINEATRDGVKEWIGLPEFEKVDVPFKMMISFDSAEDRVALLKLIGVDVIHKTSGRVVSTWWPVKQKQDLNSLLFDYEDEHVVTQYDEAGEEEDDALSGAWAEAA